MKPDVHLNIDARGNLVAQMLPDWNWMIGLLDFLDAKHVAVACDFDQNACRVTFLGQAPSYVKDLLERWTEAQPDECLTSAKSLCRKECKHASTANCPYRHQRPSVC